MPNIDNNTRAKTVELLSKFPRVRLYSGDTPLEHLPRLSAELGGGELWVKRDDLTQLAFGGNKVRQLEYYMGQAQAQRADTVLITGAVQSNFVRLAAAAANKLGMACHIQLEHRVATEDPLYHHGGNVLLDKLLGASLHHFPVGEDENGADLALQKLAEDLQKNRKKPFIIPLSPGHAPYGTLGYIQAALELQQQFAAIDTSFDQIVVGSGSGTTHAGLLFGLRLLGLHTPVIGVCVRREAELQRPRIITRCAEIAQLLGCANPVPEQDVLIDGEHLAPGYGVSNPSCAEAIRLAATQESLILDPTYTAKSMAGAIKITRQSAAGQRILYLHTGGTPGVFAYQRDVERAVENR